MPQKISTACLLILCWFVVADLTAQDPASVEGNLHLTNKDSIQRKKKRVVDVNFIFSYYDQDGIHSAVTGGTGTEKLSDYSSQILINVPLDSFSRLNIDASVNYYTSASTDNIDRDVSSASSSDIRGQMYLTYTKEEPLKNTSYGLSIGGSSETDYLSASLGVFWAKDWGKGNRSLVLRSQAFFDNILLIFPDELRNFPQTSVQTNRRHSFSFSGTFSFVLSPRFQASLAAEWIYQRGLLSTPFHRVYFMNEALPRIEKLPSHRFKFPLGLRLNYFLGKFLVNRFYYRFYQDDFGIRAHTFNLETALKFGSYFTFFPFYRYHQQKAAVFFRPYSEHSQDEMFYSSDYDLSAFHSHKWGAGFRWSPLYGIGRFRFFRGLTKFKSLDFRYAHYLRSDGLQADIFTADFAFEFE